MNPTDYALSGVLVALVGILIYTIYTVRAYNEEKKRIEEDFLLSKKYAPKNARGKLYFALMTGAYGAFFVLIALQLFYIGGTEPIITSLSATLSAKYILILGLSVLIANLSMIPIATEAMKDIVYIPSLEIPEEIRNIKDLHERTRKKEEFYEKEGVKNGSKNFGKHMILISITETLFIYGFLSFFLISHSESMNTALADNLFAAGLVFVLLAALTIPVMKKAAEIPIEKFMKKLMIAYLSQIPATAGLAIVLYMILTA